MTVSLWNLTLLVLVDYVKNKKRVSEPAVEEFPGYDVTTQVSLDPVNELMRR